MTFIPSALVVACVQALAAGEVHGGVPNEIPAQFPVTVTYEVVGASGQRRVAALELPLWTQTAPLQRNGAPEVTALVIGDVEVTAGATPDPVAPAAELTVTVTVDPAYMGQYSPNKTSANSDVIEELTMEFLAHIQPIKEMQQVWKTGFEGILQNSPYYKPNGTL